MMNKFLKLIGGLLLTASLAACGGGGGNAGTQYPSSGSSSSSGSDTTTTAVVTPASIEVFAASNELLSAGTQVVITAVVKNANNVGMADQSVVFSVNNGATLQGAATTTDDDGVATATLSAGANKALRDVTVTVTSGAAVGRVVLPVTGTAMSLTGSSSLKLAGAETYVARLVDSSGNGISGAAINVASALGNGLSATTLSTDANGNAQFIYTANRAGVDTLTVSGAGTSAQQSINVSDIDFVALSPAANTQVVVNTSQTISVRYRLANVGQSGQAVQFSTTRGSLSSSSAITDGSGVASVTISSSSSGPASVVAQIAGVGQVTLPLQFVATTPATLVLQANPGSVLPNTSGTTNQSTLEAVVLDASGNAVANRQVNFTIDSDSGNGGQIVPSVDTTDANGRAQAQFIPGAQSTRTDGVQLRATVAGTSIAGTTAMTVNGEALFISIGFGNTISNQDETTYSKTFSVYVTDSNGNAVGNQVVSLSTIPVYYGRGYLGWSGTVWTTASGAYTACLNEDRNNLNGVLDSGEDTNQDGQLTPGNPVVIAPGSVTTDSAGRSTFVLQYGEQYVPWLTVNIIAKAVVGGTESRSVLLHTLTGLASDFSTETVSPAGVNSPFGLTQSCTSP